MYFEYGLGGLQKRAGILSQKLLLQTLIEPRLVGRAARNVITLWTEVRHCAILGYYAASSGNFLPMFRDSLSVPSSGVKNNPEECGNLK